MTVFSQLKNISVNRNSRQAISLYISLFTGLIVSILVSSINTHALGADQFGDYKFLQTISIFLVTFLTFGFFVAGGRLLAIAKDDASKRRLMGGIAVIICVIYVVLVILFLLLSFYFDEVFGRKLGGLIQLTLPLLFIYPMNICLENLLKGLNAIYSLAIARLMPNVLYLVYAYFLSKNNALDLYAAYLGYLLFSATIFLGIFIYLKPSFSDVIKNINYIYEETKRYGFKVYTGILASVATMHFGGVMVAFYLDTRSAGFFLLARTVTLPLTQISTTIGTTLFKKFANSEHISQKVFVVTISSAILLLAIFYVVIDDFVIWLYPPEFKVIIPLCFIMAIGATLQGMGGMINNFVCARGYGAYSRNSSFVRGGVNIIGYTVGVKFWGVTGAATTVLASGVVFLLALIFYYRLMMRKSNT